MTALADDRHSADLDRRIADARATAARGPAPVKPQPKGYAQGSRVLAELIGTPLGGGLIGWLLDKWLGTKPWLMLILLVLSIVVAFRNIYRMSKEPAA